MNVEQLRVKVVAAEQKVEKCKKTIERHKVQLEKKAEALRKIGIEPEKADKYSFVQNGSEMNHDAYWLLCDYDNKKDDIKGSQRKLEDAERILAGWNEKLDIEINKEKIIQDTVPQVIKDFLENWKTKAFDWYVKRYDAFLEFRNDLRTAERAAWLEAYYTLPEYAETRARRKAFFGDEEPDNSTLINMNPRKPMEEFLKERGLDYHTIQQRINNFGDQIIFKMLDYRDVDARLKYLDGALEEDKKRKLLVLVDSITNITGPITNAKYLYISGGDLNGVVLGEKGVGKIQTFSAGGYNIQCFHWRTRVDDVTEKYKADPDFLKNSVRNADAEKSDLNDVIQTCEEMSKNSDARISTGRSTDKER